MADKKSIIQGFWDLFNSMRFGIILILILAIMSLYGATFLDHQTAMERVYSSWWYIAALTITAVNILVCSINRLPSAYKKVTNLKTDVDINWLENQRNKAVLDVGIGSEAQHYLIEKLNRHGYRTSAKADNKGFLISADQGRFGYWGSFIVHFSLILILAAYFYGAVGIQEDYKFGFAGDVISLEEHGFDVRIDDFKIAYRDDPQKSIEQYYSTLTVLEDGREVKTDTIFVNKPFRYKGVNLYQSNYGWGVDVAFTVNEEANKIVEKKMLPGDIGFNSNLGLYVRVLQFYPNFTMTSDGRPYSLSAYPAKPYVAFQMLNNNGDIIGNHYYIEPIGEKMQLMDGHIMEFIDYRNYTGFQIIKQPGRYIILIASIMLIIGLFMSFYLYPRKIWIYADGSKEDKRVSIFGNSHRNMVGFELEFEKIVEKLNDRREEK